MALNFGNRILDSLGTFLIGILVFLCSFVILYFTEMRTDYSVIAEKALPVDDSTQAEDFIYYSGEFTTSEKLSDGLYLKEDDYIAISREVEMFSWKEEGNTNEDDEKEYSYKKEWTEDPEDSSAFNEPKGHENPEKLIQNEYVKVANAKVGKYTVDMDDLKLPPLKTLKLNDELLEIDAINYDVDEFVRFEEVEEEEDVYEFQSGWTITEDEGAEPVAGSEDGDEDSNNKSTNEFIFIGKGSLGSPEVGDIRIKYRVYKPGEKVTVYGKIDGGELVAHHGEKEKNIYRAFEGSNEDAKAQMVSEYKTAGWVGRIAGFVVMWIGLMMLLRPVTVLFEAIPIVGGLGKSALGIVTFIIALILTVITTLILSILHSIVGVVIIAVVVIGVAYYFINKPKSELPKPAEHKK